MAAIILIFIESLTSNRCAVNKSWPSRLFGQNKAATFRKVLLLTQIVDRLADRPEGRHRNELGLHPAASRLFWIVERPPEPHPLGKRQIVEDFVAIRLIEVFQDVDRIVRGEFLNGSRDLLIRHMLDDVEPDRFIDLGQRREIEIRTHQGHERAALLGLKRFKKIADLGYVKRAELLLQRRGIARLDRPADILDESFADHAFRIVDVGAAVLIGFSNSCFFIHAPQRRPFHCVPVSGSSKRHDGKTQEALAVSFHLVAENERDKRKPGPKRSA